MNTINIFITFSPDNIYQPIQFNTRCVSDAKEAQTLFLIN